MILWPAIDILDGSAVRLAGGDFAARTVYDNDPLEAARRWVSQGARALHVVDLDGAREGRPVNVQHVRRIVEEVSIPVQVGGGLRSIEAVEEVLDAGASRAILGTAAYADIDLLDQALADHREQIVVSVDARRGLLAASGWTEQTEIPATAVIETLNRRGVKRFVYSSIERDGMLSGPDLDEVAQISEAVRGTFVYSGGVASLHDLRSLAALRRVNLAGVIVGTALYEGRFGLAEGQDALAAGTKPAT
jgi:phosphoribosylformimino-5-aminoimidazole carboxamide ribotide isomerase